jgi:hypothetical protein
LKPIQAFHIATTPDALRETSQSEDDVVWGAKMALQDALDALEKGLSHPN